MHHVIAHHAHSMHWGAIDSAHLTNVVPGNVEGDAFDITLHAAWAHARNEKAIAKGKTLQSQGNSSMHTRTWQSQGNRSLHS